MINLQTLLIREAAKDDVAKHVYADWLDEQGDCLRAELIRINLELEATSPDMGLVECPQCNPDGEPSRRIAPTGCSLCPEQSGWVEHCTPEERKHYHDLVERRLEILNELPRRWYEVMAVELDDKIWDKSEYCCSLASSESEAIINSGLLIPAYRMVSVRLLQTVVPY